MIDPNYITPALEVQLKRASQIALWHFQDAIGIIDDTYGVDYSKKNPHLLAAVIAAISAATKQQ